MELTYKKNDGSDLTCYYRDFCDTLEVLGVSNGAEYGPMIHLPVEIHKDWKNQDCEFQWEGETYRFKDFVAPTVDELIDLVATKQKEAAATGHRPWVRETLALSTFLKYPDKIGIIMEVECFNTVIPFMGIGLKGTGSKIARALLVPVEDRYRMCDWHYKIDLKAYDEEKCGQYFGREHLYFSDLWSSIVDRPDLYQLVNLDTYLDQDDPVLFELTGEIA